MSEITTMLEQLTEEDLRKYLRFLLFLQGISDSQPQQVCNCQEANV